MVDIYYGVIRVQRGGGLTAVHQERLVKVPDEFVA